MSATGRYPEVSPVAVDRPVGRFYQTSRTDAAGTVRGVLADTIVTTAGVIIVAWIGYRQEVVRRELKAYNGSVEEKLATVHDAVVTGPDAPRSGE